MTREDFYSMRMGEFFEAMDAFRNEAEGGRIHMGNLVRGLCIRVVNLFVAKKDRVNDERKFWPMPWDEPDEDDAVVVAKKLSKMSNEERQAKINDFLSKVGHVGNTKP
ncbi:MAG: hypothetical protein IKU04_01080 [Bacteroidales bacterium]|nr:hypothetical protein [Bacteroidales bacterium]